MALLGLAFWPPPYATLRGDDAAADACGAKLGSLAMAVATGNGLERAFSEQELNAHLGRLIERNSQAQQSAGLTLGLAGLAVDLTGGQSALYVDGRLGVVPLVFEARFVPGDPPSPLRLRSLRLGHLPLVGPFKMLVASQMKGLLAALPTESTVLTRLERVEMAADQITVTMPGRADGQLTLPPG